MISCIAAFCRLAMPKSALLPLHFVTSLREHNADLYLPCCPLPTPAAAANEKKAVGGVKGGQIGGEVSLCLQTHNALMLGPQCAVTACMRAYAVRWLMAG
jgi:hypothetical protein